MNLPGGPWAQPLPGCSQEIRPHLENVLQNNDGDAREPRNDRPNMIRFGGALGYHDGNSDQESARSNVIRIFTKNLSPFISKFCSLRLG